MNYKVEFLGFVYDDPVVQAAVIRQKPFFVVNPTSKPSVCLSHIVGRIENTASVESSSVMNFLGKFLGFKKKQ